MGVQETDSKKKFTYLFGDQLQFKVFKLPGVLHKLQVFLRERVKGQ